MKRTHRDSRAGFSLFEILIAAGVLVVLAGVLSLRSGVVHDNARITTATELASTLNIACAVYHADTGEFPREYAVGDADQRDLTAVQSIAGWNGPYIEMPLGTGGSNPFGGRIDLYASVTAGGLVSGFDTDGDGTEDVTSEANMLRLSDVTQEDAERVDALLDAGVQGDWTQSGRVRFLADRSLLLVLVYF